ncbi:T6SS immunity protein Tli4 family protein [Herbaspirillum sp. DW155]|uniref:hypothetical protein n=1 Tax=Herbaspirillum sp. DW155 TaxID=3095609 RepID=UPI00308B15D1|nr:T6SS immunity protein Tli4 family protein [Herbaspirillum sp. DW155]
MENIYKMTRLRSITAITLITTSICASATEKLDWRTDCVGRMKISIPGDADIAITPTKAVLEDSSSARFFFSDGVRAGYSWFSYGGNIKISNQLRPSEISSFLKKADEFGVSAREDVLTEKYRRSEDPENPFETIYANDGSKFAIRANLFFLVALVVNNHAVTLMSSVDKDQISRETEILKKIVTNIGYRANFTIPQRSGVCMPFLFVEDVENEARLAGTTYRLKDHPDITIFLEDRSAGRPGEYMRPEVFTAIYKSNFFWTQDYQDYDSIENLLKFRRHNKIPFAGQRAVESKVRMIRTDKITEDFGYLVVTQGNPDAKVDTPDLMLYVIRDAQQAIKRGIKPVPKKEFFKLARQIADSVKHRGSIPSDK